MEYLSSSRKDNASFHESRAGRLKSGLNETHGWDLGDELTGLRPLIDSVNASPAGGCTPRKRMIYKVLGAHDAVFDLLV
jgi:hypothetical protein